MELKTQSIIGIGTAVVLTGLGVGFYFIFKKPTVTSTTTKDSKLEDVPTEVSKDESSNTANATTSTTSPTQGKPLVVDVTKLKGTFPLKQGSQGELVFLLQKRLNQAYGANIHEDGKLGDETTKAICSKVFTMCLSSGTLHRKMIIDKNLFLDINQGKKRHDISLPTA